MFEVVVVIMWTIDMHGEKDGDEDGNRDNLLEGSWNSLLPVTQRLDKVEQKATQMAITMTIIMDNGNGQWQWQHLMTMAIQRQHEAPASNVKAGGGDGIIGSTLEALPVVNHLRMETC